jgi:hypothetical protein
MITFNEADEVATQHLEQTIDMVREELTDVIECVQELHNHRQLIFDTVIRVNFKYVDAEGGHGCQHFQHYSLLNRWL